jgi:hypothetical protein
LYLENVNGKIFFMGGGVEGGGEGERENNIAENITCDHIKF